MNVDENLDKFLNRNMPKTMEGFLSSIKIQINTEEADYTRDSIDDFIKRIKQLELNSRKALAEIIKLSKVRGESFKVIEIEIRTIAETLNYDNDELTQIIEKLEAEKMCYLDGDYNPIIILTGINEYQDFFYDLSNYCKNKNQDIDKLLVELKFDLLD